MNLLNSCKIKCIYDGVISNLELFAPSRSIYSTDYVDSNSSGKNPKYVQGVIPVAGTSNVIVKYSAVYMVSISIVEIWTFSDMRCQSFCSSRKYSSLASGTTSTCICF